MYFIYKSFVVCTLDQLCLYYLSNKETAIDEQDSLTEILDSENQEKEESILDKVMFLNSIVMLALGSAIVLHTGKILYTKWKKSNELEELPDNKSTFVSKSLKLSERNSYQLDIGMFPY